jgi:hypothetical protein
VAVLRTQHTLEVTSIIEYEEQGSFFDPPVELYAYTSQVTFIKDLNNIKNIPSSSMDNTSFSHEVQSAPSLGLSDSFRKILPDIEKSSSSTQNKQWYDD